MLTENRKKVVLEKLASKLRASVEGVLAARGAGRVPAGLDLLKKVKTSPEMGKEWSTAFARFRNEPAFRSAYPELHRTVTADPTTLGLFGKGRLAARFRGNKKLVEQAEAAGKQLVGIT